MKRFGILFPLLVVSFNAAAIVQTHDILVSAGDIKDSRTTEKFFAGLDVQLKLIGEAMMKVEFLNESGKQIDPQSSMRMGDVRVYDFDRQMPATAQLRLYIATPASLLSVPFTLSDISLP